MDNKLLKKRMLYSVAILKYTLAVIEYINPYTRLNISIHTKVHIKKSLTLVKAKALRICFIIGKAKAVCIIAVTKGKKNTIIICV